MEGNDWLPAKIRSGATNLIVVFHRWMRTAEVLSELILNIRKKYAFSQVIDLGSGSGGARIECFKRVNDRNQNKSINLILTDLFPNPKTVEEINKRKVPYVKYHPSPINATNISDVPKGLKTMIASFHHMKPEIAKKKPTFCRRK